MLQITFRAKSLHDLDGLYPLAQTLAHYFPRLDEVVTAIHELLMNAVEHGNLALGFEAKTELLRRGQWLHEMEQRFAAPNYKGRAVEVRLHHSPAYCELTIADEGRGFVWRDYLKRERRDARPNGRGLMIALNSPFDALYFNTRGNCVTCRAEKSTPTAKVLDNSSAMIR